MKQEEPFRDQSERLRQKIEKVKDGGPVRIETPTVMPSRTDLHRNKKNKTKLKVKFPIIRLLALFFILLPVVIISTYSYLGTKQLNASESVNGYEKVNIGEAKSNEDMPVLPADTENSDELSDSEEHDITAPEDDLITDDVLDETTPDKTEVTDSAELEEDKAVSESVNKDATSGGESTEKFIYHTVKSEENLFRIAMNYYQSQDGIKIIQEANQIQGTDIKVGQVLKIPKK
jgi:LysM repeat protein